MSYTRWLALVLVFTASTVARAGGPCLTGCTPGQKNNTCCAVNPAFGEACGVYLGLAEVNAADAQTTLDDCLSSSQQCEPTVAGRCTIVLSCVEACQRQKWLVFKGPEIRKEAFGGLTTCSGKPLNASGQKKAANICNRCDPSTVSPSTTSTVTTTTATTPTTASVSTTTTTAKTTTTQGSGSQIYQPIGDPCFTSCILQLDSVRSCYQSCNDKCEGNQIARLICERGCRNARCLAIRARCTFTQHDQNKIFPQYRKCCENSPGGCRTADEAECETTTTTTSTSSSSTATPTSTSTSTSTSIPFLG